MTITGLNRAGDVIAELERAYSKLGMNGELTIHYPNPFHQTFILAFGPNWLPPETMTTLLTQAGFAKLEHGWWLGVPKSPLAQRFSRSILARLFCPTIYFVAQKRPLPNEKKYSVSVIIPCKDEEGNIAKAVRSVPKLGRSTEIIVVDDGSTDRTAEIAKNLELRVKNLRLISYQPNKGKGHAIAVGFKAAKGDIVMDWDADMTVPASELERFVEPIARGQAKFTNGARFIYPMEKRAMRPLNFIGNKLMSLLFSWVIAQHVSDTLCGTKALFKKDWQKMTWGRDPWGDFTLLIGASEHGLTIADVPVHYLARTAGKSKMRTLQHGYQLLKAALKGTIILKFRN